MTDRPLTDDELERLTGCTQAASQARKLGEAGIPYQFLPRGSLWVLLSWTEPGTQAPRVEGARLDLVT